MEFANGDVTFAARNILLDNQADSTVSAGTGADNGTLSFDAGAISLGANRINIGQYAGVILNATGGVLNQASGSLNIQGNLTVTAPLVTAAKGATETISAGGVGIQPEAKGSATVGQAGASLILVAASIDDNGNIALPAANSCCTRRPATSPSAIMAPGMIDVSGVSQKFFDVTKYTAGGQVSLIADQGNMDIASGATVTVAA